MTTAYDVTIIGSGAAGLAAAVEARKSGAKRVLMIERDDRLGGILNQCIHPGFGLELFQEELTGPEYAWRFIKEIRNSDIEVRLNSMVLSIGRGSVHLVDRQGYQIIDTKAIILAMGCRERTRGALMIPGSRPSGVFTAGSAQRFMNIEGQLAGENIVILGSGDIGLIMARRLTLEGAKVHTVAEIMPYETGLPRNIVQCLEDFHIPLQLKHTVVNVVGRDRVEAVDIAPVDDHMQPLAGKETRYACDTLLLSVGLIPENELAKAAGVTMDPVTGGAVVDQYMQTSVPGIFAAGNALHVWDVVDSATGEAYLASRSAARYSGSGSLSDRARAVPVTAGPGIRYVVPQLLCPFDSDTLDIVEFKCRVAHPRADARITVKQGTTTLFSRRYMMLRPGVMEVLPVASSKLAGCFASREPIVVALQGEV